MTSWQALKLALIGVTTALVAVTIIVPAGEALSATITVHAPDGEGRVFVDVVGKIDGGDFETFKEKTDQIYPIAFGHSKKQVIVTLVSYGGSTSPALQIGDWIRKRGYPPSSLAVEPVPALAHSSGSPERHEPLVILL